MMANSSIRLKIRAALFDIGGVCVTSPFQAILDFEIKNNIPENWINFAISRSGHKGVWQRLERGEIKLNENEFFQQFRRELHDQKVWDEYWDVFIKRRRHGHGNPPTRSSKTPPEMDTTGLFWNMMALARHPDPTMFRTLRYLRSEHPELILAALSNTVPFPPDHPYSQPQSPDQDPRCWFDIFISSAEVGLRKPAREIYELALHKIGLWAKERGLDKIEPTEVVFLDDIGENCKMGVKVGMQVIKVNLGMTEEAVAELGRRLFCVDDLFDRVMRWQEVKQDIKSRL